MQDMKVASVAVCLTVASVLALAGGASGQTPPRDSVVGSGSVDADGSTLVTFDVSSGPSGENPTGKVTFSLGGQVLESSSVGCLTVDGSSASFAGTWLPNANGATHYEIVVVDNGIAASTPDLLGMITTTNAPRDCSAVPGVDLPLLPLVTGGLVVRDARPLPTSTGECKNGGWRSFGVFKNQGDCVSYVATKGKNGRRGRTP
jgi:hypothetical protein